MRGRSGIGSGILQYKQARPSERANAGGKMQLKVSVYAKGRSREREEADDPAYAAMTVLLGCGDVLAAFAGAISDTGTLCQPVTSGIDGVPCCGIPSRRA